MSLASHEIKTPLTAITAYSQVIEKKAWKNDPSMLTYVQKMQAEIKRLNQLVTEFLGQDTINLDSNLYNWEECHIHELMDKARANFSLLFPSHKIIVKTSIDIHNDYVRGDFNKLLQVFNNILQNAGKYSAESSTITVTLKENPSMFIITAKDEGKGIPEKDVQTLNKKFNIASESAELKEGKVSYTVKSAMEQMIIISHNYAALLLSDKVKLATVKSFLQTHNLTESSVGSPPKTTPYDVARWFEKLYKGELANQESTQKMLSLLKRQQLNHKIPKYLPKGTTIAHKTGELGAFTHDAGIIYSEKGDYIIVIMSESNSPLLAQERVSEVSRVIYNYFSSKAQ